MYGSTDKDIWKADGVGFDVYVGGDLENWRGPRPAFRPPEGFWGVKNFWAPEVYEYGGAFYMFASFIGPGYNRGTAVLKAPRPEGPFAPHSAGAVTPAEWMCLDGTLYIDENARPHMVFCHEWVQTGDGTLCSVELDDTLSRAVSPPIELFASSDAAWSGKAYSPSNKIEGYVTDGCFPYRLTSGKLLMLWSCVGEKGYCLGYAVSPSGLLRGPWLQAPEPLFAADGGHGMVFRSYGNKLLLALHRPNETPRERAMFIEVEETEDGLRRADA
jgi:hypothetical protein